MIYLVFNEGYSRGRARPARAPLCDEAIRLARLLLRLFQTEPEIMGLTALMLLQHARAAARFDADGEIVLLDDQDRGAVGRQADRRGPGADRQGDAPPACPGPTRSRRPSPRCMHAPAQPEDTDWAQIDALYATLERLQPSPVVTLNRAVAVSKVSGPEAALAMIEPLADRLAGYFHFFGAKGAFLLQLGRTRRGAHRLRPGDRAGQHAGGGGAYPPASRPADARERPLTIL